MTKKEIIAEATKQNKNGDFAFQDGFYQGAEFVQSQQSGMRWKSPVTDFPEAPFKTVLARFVKNPNERIAGNFGVQDGEAMFQALTYVEAEWYPLSEIEWLDESGDHTSEIEKLRGEHKLMYVKLKQIQALIEVKGSYDLLEPINSLISKIESNGK